MQQNMHIEGEYRCTSPFKMCILKLAKIIVYTIYRQLKEENLVLKS